MRAISKRAVYVVTIVVCVLLLCGLFLPMIPPNYVISNTIYYCKNCGTRLGVTEYGYIRSSDEKRREETIYDTPLSQWYKKHIGDDCDHHWQESDVTVSYCVSLRGILGWGSHTECANYGKPQLLHLSDVDKEKLESLLDQSPETCKEFIREQLDNSKFLFPGFAPSEKPITITESIKDLNRDGIADRISIQMIKGRHYMDESLWAGQGEKFEGSFVIRVEIQGKDARTHDLNAFFRMKSVFFGAKPWKIRFADYNHDGQTDFNLGQYACSNGWMYKLFTISMRGEVSELTIEGKDYLFVSDRENSTAEIIETEKGFSHSYYDNSRGRGFISSYRWDRTKRVFIFVEEDEPSGQSLSDILAAYRIPRSLGLFAMSVSYEE